MKISEKFKNRLKLFVLIALFFFLIYDLTLVIVVPKINMEGVRVVDALDIYFAYFTTQSNYIVVIYLFFSHCLKKFYKKKPAFGIEIAITVYITITMIVFWAGLMSDQNEQASYKPIHWVSTFMLHLFIPLLMISNFLIGCGDYHINIRDHSKFSMIAILMYPVLYSVYIMLRGHFRFEAYGPDFFMDNFWQVKSPDGTLTWNSTWFEDGLTLNARPYPNLMFYPYYFLDINYYVMKYNVYDFPKSFNLYSMADINNWTQFKVAEDIAFENTKPFINKIFMLIGSGFSVFGMCIGLQFLYLWHNNAKYNRWHDYDGRILTKEEHKEKMLTAKFVRIGRSNEKRLTKTLRKQNYNEAKEEWKKAEPKVKKQLKKVYFEKLLIDKNERKGSKKFDKFIKTSEISAFKKYLSSIPDELQEQVKEATFEDWRIKKELKRLGEENETLILDEIKDKKL